MAKKIYTAYVTRNRRSISSAEPKALLVDIHTQDGELFRNHCWVSEEVVKELVPKRHSKEACSKVTFRANTHNYMSCDKHGNVVHKQGLQNIKIIYP